MTLQWNPTPGHTYRIYEKLSTGRKYLGTTTGGQFQVPGPISRGTHRYFITVKNEAGESLPSNEIVFTKRKR